jgi:hypothetical protein
MNCHKWPRTWTDSVDKRPKLKKMGMKLGTWNVRSLYRAGSLMTIARFSGREYRRSDGTEVSPIQQANMHFSMERGMRIMN